MKRQEERISMSDSAFIESIEEMKRSSGICFEINHTMPMTEAYRKKLEELFEGRLPETSTITSPLQIDMAKWVTIRDNVFINNNIVMMARGGITIEEGVMIGPGAFLLTANHDLIDHQVLLCSPIHIKEYAWIGANAKILPGVTIGAHAVVASGAVVTKNVEDWTVVGGNPARVIRTIEHEK